LPLATDPVQGVNYFDRNIKKKEKGIVEKITLEDYEMVEEKGRDSVLPRCLYLKRVGGTCDYTTEKKGKGREKVRRVGNRGMKRRVM